MASSCWLGRVALCALLSGAGATAAVAADVADATKDDGGMSAFSARMTTWNDMDATAPVDFGPGRGKGRPAARKAAAPKAAMTPAVAATAAGPRTAARPFSAVPSAAVPQGGSDAGANGFYGPPAMWPIIPIHASVMPDGRVVSFGTDSNGIRGAELYYDVWDPSLGTDTTSHFMMPNTTDTDIFCSFASLTADTGDLITAGGDLRPQRKPNNSTAETIVINPNTSTFQRTFSMVYPRWYGTVVPMPNGQMVALGGRQEHVKTINIGAPTPEVFTPATGWQALTTATSNQAFFNGANWFYPRAVVAPNGLLYVFTFNGYSFWLDPTGTGTLTSIAKIPPAHDSQPIAMFAPGKVLSLRNGNQAYVMDLTGANPAVTPTGNLSQIREWSNATVLADGQVLVNGGSTVSNQLVGLGYQNETWNPVTGQWSLGAIAAKPRLYHSIALLLADGSVLTGGGGSPGPVKMLNAEVFYPPYLYAKDGSGNPAPRPTLATDTQVVTVGGSLTGSVGANDQIARMTMVKLGSVTHALNIDQRFLELAFTQTGQQVAATLEGNPNVLQPGFYMVFAFNTAGTPSVANIVQVLPPQPQRPRK